MRNVARSAPNAAPTMKPIAPASRRAERRHCNACRKTCRAFRRLVKAPCARWKLLPNRRASRLQPQHPRSRRQHRTLRQRQSPASQPRNPRQRRRRRHQVSSSRAAPRSARSVPPAAPTIQTSAPACQPAARPHCSAWRTTRRSCRPTARRRLLLRPALPQRRQLRARPPRPLRLPRRRWYCGRCCRARNCSSCALLAAPTFAPFAAASHPAAAGSFSASPCGRNRSRRSAAACCPGSLRNERVGRTAPLARGMDHGKRLSGSDSTDRRLPQPGGDWIRPPCSSKL